MVMCFSFICVVLYSLKKSQKVKCNCFGNLTEEKIGINTFIHIVLLIIPTLYILFSEEKLLILKHSFTEVGYAIFLNVGLFMAYILISSMKKFHDAIKMSSY
ncbi:hypothetical protein [Lysinibacillus boronitolerans]|uniref:hypothetical protein n=1 Tax=Lysinibacillus boronitolerans TaxID=309788 RepID=UPI0038518906